MNYAIGASNANKALLAQEGRILKFSTNNR